MGNSEFIVYFLVFINVISLIYYLISVIKVFQDKKIDLKLFFIDFCVALSTLFILSSVALSEIFASMFALWCLSALAVMTFLNY